MLELLCECACQHGRSVRGNRGRERGGGIVGVSVTEDVHEWHTPRVAGIAGAHVEGVGRREVLVRECLERGPRVVNIDHVHVQRVDTL